jgi:hypothetical protein
MAGGQQFVDQDLRVFRHLSLWLCDNHEKPWEYKDKKARATYEKISLGYHSIRSSDELEGYLPTEEKVRSEFPIRKYLYLNPVEGQALVPILRIACDFGCSIPELRIRLALFLSHDDKTRGFGYRFESPEGPGIHHYYHAQPITDLKAGESFLDAEDWLPTKCPTFPLDADNPVKLLLSLLISLYGISYISQIKQHVRGIDHHLGKMHFENLPDWIWYRKVTMHGGRVEYHYTSDPDNFDKVIKAKYQKCKVSGITKGMYDRSGAGRSSRASRKP